VIENLLSNAVKFSPAGSEVRVKLIESGDRITRLEVTDVGPGISADNLPKLFEKFQQLDSPDHRSHGGTGLGLAICKALVEAHGGRIGVISEVGKGCTFWVEMALI
jgi:signal transduction histidine kinase